MARSTLRNIEDLKTWFDQCNYVRWNLYRGLHEKLPQTSIIYRQENNDMTLEESWDLLSQLIETSSHGGGQFTVYVIGGSANKGFTQKIEVGMPTSPAQNPALSGLHGVGFVPAAELAKQIAAEKRLWDLERQLEDTQAALGANQTMMERLAGNFMETFDWNQLAPALNGLIGKLSGAIPAAQPISLQGLPSNGPGATPPAAEDGGTEPEYQFLAERLLPPLTRIRPHFNTDEQFYQFLELTADQFCQNPKLMKSMIMPKSAQHA